MKTEIKNKVHGGDAQMSHSSKLAQIKSGAKNKRSTGGAEKKAVVTTGKDGSKFIINETEEKFEETAVLRKKKNYVMYEAKLGTEKTTDITKIAGPQKAYKPKPKPTREIEPRVEEKIVLKKKKKEYLDNYQYHETKDIKNPNPRLQVVVEHQRLGEIIGGTFEETSYQRQVFSQGSNRPQLTEKTTTTRTTGTANPGALRGNKSSVTLKKTTITGSAPKPSGGSTVSKRTTTTTNATRNAPTTSTAKNEKITETTIKRRNDGTGGKTETKTETKTTTTSGTRGGETGSTSTTTKTTTTRTASKPAAETTQQTSTTTKTTTTKTTTTKTITEGDGGAETKTESKTVTKTEEKSGSTGEEAKGENTGGEATGGSTSIRKKYAKGRFSKQ